MGLVMAARPVGQRVPEQTPYVHPDVDTGGVAVGRINDATIYGTSTPQGGTLSHNGIAMVNRTP